MTHQSSHVFPIRKGVYSNDTSKFEWFPIRKVYIQMTHQSSHVFPIRKGVYSNDTSKFPCFPYKKGCLFK